MSVMLSHLSEELQVLKRWDPTARTSIFREAELVGIDRAIERVREAILQGFKYLDSKGNFRKYGNAE